VKIRNIAHKGLNRLREQDDSRGLPPGCVDKLRKMIAYLEAMEDVSELRMVPVWKAHILTGGRKGAWSLHVTRNWRLTFWIDKDARAICDLNFEDYH
jgi:proteic killer suppression protein